MNIIVSALKFENSELRLSTPDDRDKAVKKLKELITGLSTIYDKTKDPYLMEIMQRLRTLQNKVEFNFEPLILN